MSLVENTDLKSKKIRYWAQDETRIGLKTITGKVLTAKGIKPRGNYQWFYKYLWLYGLIEAETGESFFYEFSHLDSTCMECFLDLFSRQYPHDLHIIQLDNGPLHQSFQMSIPNNIILLFQPPYSPELNPIERLWEEIKKELRWLIFNNLDELREQIKKILNNLSESTIKSLGGWDFILQALSIVRFRQAIFFSE